MRFHYVNKYFRSDEYLYGRFYLAIIQLCDNSIGKPLIQHLTQATNPVLSGV